MKIFFDTEFTGLHQNTTLISIGLVSEDNKTFYAEFTDYDTNQLNDWIQNNVLNNLYVNSSQNTYIPNYHIGTHKDIAIALKNWLSQFDYVELVSDVCHYDMTLFVELFGGSFRLPNNVSPACYDINQDIARYYKISMKDAFDKNREEILYNYHKELPEINKHNALYDAKVIKEIYYILHPNERKD